MKCTGCGKEIGMKMCPVVIEVQTFGCIKNEEGMDVLYVPSDLDEEHLRRVSCPFCSVDLSKQIRGWWYSDEFDKDEDAN